MENVERRYVDVFGADTLTWAEYNLEYFAKAILERATSIVQPKETVSDFDKAIWFTSLTILLGKMLPPNRFLFRIMEDQDSFLIQFHDTAKLQQSQTIEVPYRKVYNWGITSWEDAIKLSNKERVDWYNKWKKDGFTDAQIGNHFNIPYFRIYSWVRHDSRNSSLAKRNEIHYADSKSGIVRRSISLLKEAGLNRIASGKLFADAYTHVTGYPSNYDILQTTKRCNKRAMSSEIDKCLDISICYVKSLIDQINETNAQTYVDTHIRKFLVELSRTTKINLCGKRVWFPEIRKERKLVNHEGLEECLEFYNNVLTNLNKMKGELK